MSRPPRFTWKTTDGADHEFEVTAAEISVGRAPTCDIVLADDQMVSRRHAVIRRQGNVCTLVDLGSSNGTLINGVEIHDATILKQNDRVTIGDQDLLFFEAADVPQPVAAGMADMQTIAPGSIPAYSVGPVPPSIWAPPPPIEVVPPTPPQPHFDIYSEQDTGSLGIVDQVQGSYIHTHNGQVVDEDKFAGHFAEQINVSHEWAPLPSQPLPPPASAPTPTPAPSYQDSHRQDPSALLATIKQLHEQLETQVGDANVIADRVRCGIQQALKNLDSALQSAQTVAQQQALADIQQLADTVSRSPLVDQVATLARRSSEIRDVLAAHQALIAALTDIRHQLEQAMYN